jgi:glycosyltransferase involved in cell wall biosynthesis
VKPVFSILIPAIFERLDRLKGLVSELERQILLDKVEGVEIVSVVDNRIVTVGEKRQMVLDCSHGDYVAFVDDDDGVSVDYARRITKAIMMSPGIDVITFDNISFIEDHKPITINMRLRQENEDVRFDDDEANPRPVVRRGAWHMCAWRAELAKAAKFPVKSYGEDWEWAKQLNDVAKTEHHIDAALHVYTYKRAISRATPD